MGGEYRGGREGEWKQKRGWERGVSVRRVRKEGSGGGGVKCDRRGEEKGYNEGGGGGGGKKAGGLGKKVVCGKLGNKGARLDERLKMDR